MKKILFYCATLFLIVMLSACQNDTETLKYSNIFGGDGSQIFVSACELKNGNVVLLGSNDGGSEVWGSSKGDKDIVVIIYDSALEEVISTNSFGGTLKDDAQNIVCNDNEIYIALETISEDAFGSSKGGQDIVIIKMSETGVVTWENRVGGSGNDVLTDFDVDTEGNCYLTGYTLSSDLDFKTTIEGRKEFVMKISAQGQNKWVIYQEEVGLFSSLSIDKNNDIVVGGFTRESSELLGTIAFKFDRNQGQARDIVLIKYNPEGNIIWAAKKKSNNSDLDLKKIDIDSNGNIYAIGSAWYAARRLGSDPLLFKYDSNGVEIWSKELVDLEYGSALYDLEVYQNNTILVNGTLNFDYTKYTNVEIGGYIIKFDSSGYAVWQNKTQEFKMFSSGYLILSDSRLLVYGFTGSHSEYDAKFIVTNLNGIIEEEYAEKQ